MVVEYNIGLIVGSLPTLRKLGVFRRILDSSQRSLPPTGGRSSGIIYGHNSQGSYPLQKAGRNSRSLGKSNIGEGTVVVLRSESSERIIGDPDGDHN